VGCWKNGTEQSTSRKDLSAASAQAGAENAKESAKVKNITASGKR
jgi:hypothetical protein